MARCSASVMPEVTKSCGAPASSMVAMAPKRAPVSDRALPDNLVEHGLEVEARADAEARRAERRDARA